jgi:hypothetical protein
MVAVADFMNAVFPDSQFHSENAASLARTYAAPGVAAADCTSSSREINREQPAIYDVMDLAALSGMT